MVELGLFCCTAPRKGAVFLFFSAAFQADHQLLILDRTAIVCFPFLQPIDMPASMLHNHPPQFHQSITMISLQDSGDVYKFYSSTKCMCGCPILSRSVYNSECHIHLLVMIKHNSSWLGGLLNNLHFSLTAPQSHGYFSDTKLGVSSIKNPFWTQPNFFQWGRQELGGFFHQFAKHKVNPQTRSPLPLLKFSTLIGWSCIFYICYYHFLFKHLYKG